MTMDFAAFRDFLTVLGALVVVVGAAACGSLGMVIVQNWLARWSARCRYDYREDPPYCKTHNCGPYDQCGLVECPHCVYKCDDEMEAYGYPIIFDGKKRYADVDGCYTLPNGDCIAPDCLLHGPRLHCTVGEEKAPGWYCTRVQGHDGPCAMVPTRLSNPANYNTGERCAPDADPSNPANYTHTNYNTGEPCPPDCGMRADEPVKVRITRVKPENFAYRMDGRRITDAIETDDTGNVIAEYHEQAAEVEYTLWEALVQKSAEEHGTIPHCDSNVLHAPGDCEFCDSRPELQEFRLLHGMAFTGQKDDTLLTCPAELARPLETIEKWGGNVKETPERRAARERLYREPLPTVLDWLPEDDEERPVCD